MFGLPLAGVSMISLGPHDENQDTDSILATLQYIHKIWFTAHAYLLMSEHGNNIMLLSLRGKYDFRAFFSLFELGVQREIRSSHSINLSIRVMNCSAIFLPPRLLGSTLAT